MVRMRALLSSEQFCVMQCNYGQTLHGTRSQISDIQQGFKAVVFPSGCCGEQTVATECCHL
jgi:hypothetical protein